MDIESVKNDVRQYVALKDQANLINDRQTEIKKRLTSIIDENGKYDERGHISLDIEDEVSGVASIVKQRKVSKNLDMQVAEDLLTKRGIKDACIEMVPTLNESAIMAAFYEGKLSEEDIDAMFPEKVTYAFTLKNK